MSPFVKICGLANEGDTRETHALAPDALGFVFWPRSPRAVTAEQVAAWTRDLPSGPLKVGVFVDQSRDEVRRIFDVAGLDLVQLHGAEDAEYILNLGLPVWKAIHLDRGQPDPHAPVRAVLLDSGTVDMPGGSGKRVDVARARAYVLASPLPVLLAGGLKADTVAEAVRTVKPWGVDVSSGVERSPGLKDMAAVRAFIPNARAAGVEPEKDLP